MDRLNFATDQVLLQLVVKLQAPFFKVMPNQIKQEHVIASRQGAGSFPGSGQAVAELRSRGKDRRIFLEIRDCQTAATCDHMVAHLRAARGRFFESAGTIFPCRGAGTTGGSLAPRLMPVVLDFSPRCATRNVANFSRPVAWLEQGLRMSRRLAIALCTND
jgi:hypothetical protein